MEHTLRFASFCRMFARQRLDAGHELLEDDKTIWTVAELIEELQAMPPDAPVIVESEDDGTEDLLFALELRKDTEGNEALFVCVDMREPPADEDPSNARLTAPDTAHRSDDE